mgnify:FL=1
MKNFNKIILSLGSNIGDRKLHLENAVSEISKIANLIKISSIYESDPILYDDQDKFLNIILEIEFENSSIKLLEKTKDIEKKLGRKEIFRFGPRVIDIDIIFFNNEVIKTKNLTIPHYDWKNRNFVILPLSELFNEFISKDYKLDIQKINKVGNININ